MIESFIGFISHLMAGIFSAIRLLLYKNISNPTPYFLLCVALLCTIPQHSFAAPTIVLNPSRSSGPAPLAVLFDASSTTDAGTTEPFHDLEYSWDFDDPSAGTWDYGTGQNNEKNEAKGAVAAHVFEDPGSYDVELVVYNGSEYATTTTTITVTNPDTVFSGASTVCLSTSGTFTGCPSGATQVATSSFDSAINAHLSSNKRLLFRGGETFTQTAVINTGASTDVVIGSYGTGKAIVSKADDIQLFTVSTSTTSRWKFVDLDIQANTTDAAAVFGMAASTNAYDFLILRVDVSQTQMIGQAGSISPPVTAGSWNNLFIQDSTQADHYAGNAYFGALISGALLGNEWGPVGGGTAEHIVRLQGARRSVVAHNTFYSAAATKSLLTIRGQTHQTGATEDPDNDTYYVVVSDNLFDNTIEPLAVWIVQFAPSGSTQCQWGRDIIFERNKVIYGPGSNGNQRGLVTEWSDISVRNNLFDASQLTGHAFWGTSVFNGQSTGSACADSGVTADNTLPVPNGNRYLNNVFYSGATTTSFFGVALEGNQTTGVTNMVVKNNLAYLPKVTSTTRLPYLVGTTTGANASNNSTDSNSTNQIRLVNPFSTTSPSAFSDFHIATSSYAYQTGTNVSLWSDFFGTQRPQQGTFDMGLYEYTVPADTTPPSAPSNLLATSIGTSTFNLSWDSSTDNVGVSGYYVYRDGSLSSTTVVTSYPVTGLTASTSYLMLVTAFDAAGNRSASSTLSVTTSSTPDVIAPTLAEVTPVPTPATDTTPDYTFSSTESGTITYGGSCASVTTSASVGNNTITFNALAVGTYSDCTISVTDSSNNTSTPLSVTSFTITEASSGGGGGGGGGGGSSSSKTKTSTSTETTATTPSIAALLEQVRILQEQLNALRAGTVPAQSNSNATLPRNIGLGSQGEDVRTLQKLLNTKGFTIAVSGPGSLGNETDWFGPATQSALIRYQNTYAQEILTPAGLAAGNGYAGPLTRAHLTQNTGTSQTPSIGSTALTKDLGIGVTDAEVLILQRLLNAAGFSIAESGVGSPGNETTFFGNRTEAAVMRFQEANQIPATGFVGTRTRSALEQYR